MKQIKFKIDSILLAVYKGNITPLIQFNSNSDNQIEILTISEILDRVTVVSGGYKGALVVALPINFDYSVEFANKLHTLIIQLTKAGYKICIKADLQTKLLQYVFNANLQAEFLVGVEKIQYETILNLTDKITLSFGVDSRGELDPIISFIKLIRPHTKAKFNLYVTGLTSFSYNDLCNTVLLIPNIIQLSITLDKTGY